VSFVHNKKWTDSNILYFCLFLNMNKIKIIGLILIILGIAMLLFGAAMFTYAGPPLNPIIYNLGKYSFYFWLPTIIVGIGFATWPVKREKH
jgi:hypothetical protein